jgi:D-alanine-D-alanine ligase
LKIENSKLKIAVLTGGIGEERDISIRSGNCVTEALKQAGLNVAAADVTPEKLRILEDETIDVFFLALHGRFGEDGQLQQILEDKSLVYTGSGPQASRLAFDKLASKRRFVDAGITVPRAVTFDGRAEPKELEKKLLNLSETFVVKPLRQGSTIGIAITADPKSALLAAQQCSHKFGDCMIEEFIPGRELTVGILENQALPIIEVKSKTGFYDYRAKYLDERTEFLFDTIDDPALTAKIEAAALDCFNALGCRHFGRVDLILSNEQSIYALEVNSIPGFTDRSDLPKAAAKAGLSMSRLCTKIIEAALKSKNSKEPFVGQPSGRQK